MQNARASCHPNGLPDTHIPRHDTARHSASRKLKVDFATAATALTSLYKGAGASYGQGVHEACEQVRRFVERSSQLDAQAGAGRTAPEGYVSIAALIHFVDAVVDTTTETSRDPRETCEISHTFGRRRSRCETNINEYCAVDAEGACSHAVAEHRQGHSEQPPLRRPRTGT